MSRQIVNTGGQGLASSDALKAAFGALAVAVVVLLVFFFLNSSTKSRTAALAPAATAVTATR
jgi:hypothetical protein